MGVYRFSMQYNGSYAFRHAPRLTANQRVYQEVLPDMSGRPTTGPRRCEKCSQLLMKWDDPLNGLIITRSKYDISVTYDFVTVVSRRFVSVWNAYALHGLVFQTLPDDPGFAAIRASRSVRFDAERRGVRFINKCDACGRYESVLDAIPVLLVRGATIGEKECVRTDLEFGSGDQMGPLLLCGETAAQVLTAAGLSGLSLVELGDQKADKKE